MTSADGIIRKREKSFRAVSCTGVGQEGHRCAEEDETIKDIRASDEWLQEYEKCTPAHTHKRVELCVSKAVTDPFFFFFPNGGA